MSETMAHTKGEALVNRHYWVYSHFRRLKHLMRQLEERLAQIRLVAYVYASNNSTVHGRPYLFTIDIGLLEGPEKATCLAP